VRTNPAEKKQIDQQLINEARAAGRLCHPNIVTIYDAGTENGSSYIAMEYLQGAVLAKRLEAGEKFTPEQVAAISGKLADALGHAHKNGVTHRDVNPSNIFLSDEFEPKIFDFGIARAPNRIAEDGDDDDQPYTLFRNNLLGTPNYMSPEQATGKPADQLTDVYSLGAVMYEMLAQRKPFQSETTEALLEAIAYKAPQAPHEINPGVPIGLSQIVMKAMSKRTEKRYQSAQEMAQDIQRHVHLGRPRPQPPAPRSRPRRRKSKRSSRRSNRTANARASPPSPSWRSARCLGLRWLWVGISCCIEVLRRLARFSATPNIGLTSRKPILTLTLSTSRSTTNSPRPQAGEGFLSVTCICE